jgi:hypothetical protein
VLMLRGKRQLTNALGERSFTEWSSAFKASAASPKIIPLGAWSHGVAATLHGVCEIFVVNSAGLTITAQLPLTRLTSQSDVAGSCFPTFVPAFGIALFVITSFRMTCRRVECVCVWIHSEE